MSNCTLSGLSPSSPGPHDPAPPLVDVDEVAFTLLKVLPQGGERVIEVRALEATLIGDRSWPATYTGFFNDQYSLTIALLTIESARGVYLTPNPANPALLARANNRLKKAGKGDCYKRQRHRCPALALDRLRRSPAGGDFGHRHGTRSRAGPSDGSA